MPWTIACGCEGLARRLVHDEIQIALPVAALLVGQAVPLLGQRAQGLGQQAQRVALTDSSPVLVLNSCPDAPTMSPMSQSLNQA
jgi:hypothetical protein